MDRLGRLLTQTRTIIQVPRIVVSVIVAWNDDSCYADVMAFIALRRSRNTLSYYLVESYRDGEGRSRKRTLCYLGRQQDGADTLANALAHWERVREQAIQERRLVKGDRLRIVQRRRKTAEERIKLLREHLKRADDAQGRRQGRQRLIEAEQREHARRAEEAIHWQAIERLRRIPTPENAEAAKRAFRVLALHYHPDQGGSHQAFLTLKQTYDAAVRAGRLAAA